jgi:hypothetical protein
VIVLLVVATACKAKSEKAGAGPNPEGTRGGPGQIEPTTTGSGARPNEPTPVAPDEQALRAQSIADGAALQFGKRTDGSTDDSAAIHALPAGVGSGAPIGTLRLGKTAKLDDTSLTIEAVATKIESAYLSALVACYRHRLATEPTLAGTAQLTWRVKTDGTIEQAKATAPSPQVGACFQAAMQAWSFAAPTRAGTPAVASFQAEVTLAP